MRHRRFATRVGFAVAALALAGCSGSTTESQPTATVTVTQSPTAEPTPTPMDTGSLTPRPDGPPVLAFGVPFDYSDGITVNVTNLGTNYVDYGAESSGGQIVELELAITNNTGAAWDPAGSDGTMTYGADGVAAEEVFSSENGWSGGYFTGTILPGRTATVKTAYAVPNVGVGDLVFEFTPAWGDWERGAVFYVSQP